MGDQLADQVVYIALPARNGVDGVVGADDAASQLEQQAAEALSSNLVITV